MTAGMNLVMRFWREDYKSGLISTDDAVGGAVPTGTVLYEAIEARIFIEKPTTALLEQGAETLKIFSAVVSPLAKNLREFDVGEVLLPIDNWYFGDKFRIISVQHPSMNSSDPRQYVRLSMRRYEIAHDNENQR